MKFSYIQIVLVFLILGGSGCKKQSDQTQIPAPTAPVADFTFTGGNFFAPIEISFQNLSQNSSTYLWDFGDGTTSNENSPKHIFQNKGTYLIKLTAKGAAGMNSITKEIKLEAQPPIADFSYPTGKLVAPVEIPFQNLSQNSSTYLWDFGDGTTSTEKDPKHTFQKIGIYFIKLKAIGQGGEIQITKKIEVDASGTFHQSVILALDTSIIPGINQKLNQFMADLVFSGHKVVVHNVVENKPKNLRDTIKAYYSQLTPKLEGVIFIGSVPIPIAKYIYPNPSPGIMYEGLSMQYYMDLDGNYSFQGGEVSNYIDSHTGNVEIEIWTSILPYYKSQGLTVDYINEYLTKNHNYRSGAIIVQRGFIDPVIGNKITTESLYNYQYQIIKNEYYVKLNLRGNFFVGIDNKLGDLIKFPTSRISYEQEMLTDKYDIASIGAHGSGTSFGIVDNDGWGSMFVDITYAQTKIVKPVFLLEHSCSNGNIASNPSLGSEFLYNKNNNVLVFAGATAPQGGMGMTIMGKADNYQAELLTSGKSIGVAYFGPMTLPYQAGIFRDFREAYSAQQILLGDGTLKLQEFMPH